MKHLIINGHPNQKSFCTRICQKLHSTLSNTSLLSLYELSFNPVFNGTYSANDLEPDLQNAQAKIKSAAHITLVFPTWWWSVPALLKGFLDRTLTPGFAFSYKSSTSQIQQKLLKGKTATIITTMDSPKWFAKYLMGNVLKHQIAKGVFGFCGIKVTRIIVLDRIKFRESSEKQKMIDHLIAKLKA